MFHHAKIESKIMRELFPEYYKNDNFEEIWKHAIFVFDTNALLNLYRLPKESREALLTQMQNLSQQLWIPFQVAFEFQRNRLSVIADQRKRYREVRNEINSQIGKLISNLSSLQLKTRHSSINPDGFIEAVEDAKVSFLDELDSLEKSHPDVHDTDGLLAKIDKLFSGRIGPAPKNQEDLEQLCSEGEKRYKNKIPPGYEDSEKKETYTHNTCTYMAKFGDLIMWRQLINFAKEQAVDHIVLISDDGKEDWMWIVESGGPKTIGPRPELIQELKMLGGIKSFSLYSSSNFLKHASRYGRTEISKQIYEQFERTLNGQIHSDAGAENLDSDLALVRLDVIDRYLADLELKISQSNMCPDEASAFKYDSILQLESLDLLEKFLRNDMHRMNSFNARLRLIQVISRLDNIANTSSNNP